MANAVPFSINELQSVKKYPETLYYKGSLDLLYRPKISIVGTRRPNPYTRALTLELSRKLANAGMVIVSGAAAGVDALSHEGAGVTNTIAVLPCGIDIRYPVRNGALIEAIENNGLGAHENIHPISKTILNKRKRRRTRKKGRTRKMGLFG